METEVEVVSVLNVGQERGNGIVEWDFSASSEEYCVIVLPL